MNTQKYTPDLPAVGQFSFSDRPVTLARTVAESYAPNRLLMYDGDVNVVAVADEHVSIKVPQKNDELARNAFSRELKAYQLLKDVDLSPILIPRLVTFSSDPAYLITTYVPGRTIGNDEIKIFPNSVLVALGRSIGQYVARQSVAVDFGLAQEILPTGAPHTLTSEFNIYLRDFEHPAYPNLGKLANMLYERWYKRHIEEPDVFIHGDLQPANMTLDENDNLHGVLDFGRATMGKISEELSAFCAVDSVLFESCVRQLEKEGVYVDREQTLLCRVMRDLMVLTYWISHDKINNPYFKRFRDRIAERYAQFDWGELYRPG